MKDILCHKKSFSANDDKERPERSSYERNKTSEERDISSVSSLFEERAFSSSRVLAFLFVFYCLKKRAIEKRADLVRIPITSETHSFPYIYIKYS